MHKRLWLSVVAVAIGAALLIAAGFASPAKSSTSGANSSFAGAKKGGTLRLNMSSSDVDYIDPALAYYQLSWDILYIACRPCSTTRTSRPPRGRASSRMVLQRCRRSRTTERPTPSGSGAG